MIYITGDTHGSYRHLRRYFRDHPVDGNDNTLIVLGDTGLNYYGDERDDPHLKSASRLPLALFCVRGNHDRSPETVEGNRLTERFGGPVYVNPVWPDIFYAVHAGLYTMAGQSVLVIGGAFSVDRDWRLSHGYHWFADEQLSNDDMKAVEKTLDSVHWQIDTVLTHTCPLRYEPKEALFESVDQTAVDKTMETWLDTIEARLQYRQWMCGHFHIDKSDGRIRFLHQDVVTLQAATPHIVHQNSDSGS